MFHKINPGYKSEQKDIEFFILNIPYKKIPNKRYFNNCRFPITLSSFLTLYLPEINKVSFQAMERRQGSGLMIIKRRSPFLDALIKNY